MGFSTFYDHIQTSKLLANMVPLHPIFSTFESFLFLICILSYFQWISQKKRDNSSFKIHFRSQSLMGFSTFYDCNKLQSNSWFPYFCQTRDSFAKIFAKLEQTLESRMCDRACELHNGIKSFVESHSNF